MVHARILKGPVCSAPELWPLEELANARDHLLLNVTAFLLQAIVLSLPSSVFYLWAHLKAPQAVGLHLGSAPPFLHLPYLPLWQQYAANVCHVEMQKEGMAAPHCLGLKSGL